MTLNVLSLKCMNGDSLVLHIYRHPRSDMTIYWNLLLPNKWMNLDVFIFWAFYILVYFSISFNNSQYYFIQNIYCMRKTSLLILSIIYNILEISQNLFQMMFKIQPKTITGFDWNTREKISFQMKEKLWFELLKWKWQLIWKTKKINMKWLRD